MRDIEDCRPYLQHLTIEHRHLHQVLRQIQESLAELCGAQQKCQEKANEFVAQLCKLRDELDQHYAEEESGGCMEEAESRCPGVVPDVKRVEAEHPELRREMDRLVANARSLAGSPDRLLEFRRDFDLFATKLRKHEAAENRIMLYGFGAEAMDEIMEDPNHID